MAKRLQELSVKTVDENEKFVIVDTADSSKTKLVASSEISKSWHTHTASEVTDFDTEVSNNTTVAANTAKISYNSTASDKLATIETSATADQTWAEIKSAYEAEADTNAYTDAEKTKLAWLSWSVFAVSATFTLTFDDEAQSNVVITNPLSVAPKNIRFIFPNQTTHGEWMWCTNDATITSLASVRNWANSRIVTTNATIATWNDSNSSRGDWRVDSANATSITLDYTIVSDWGSRFETTLVWYAIISA